MLIERITILLEIENGSPIALAQPAMTTQEQLEKLVIEQNQAFLGFVQKRVSDFELAKDILQESFLKAVKSADQLQSDEQVTAWFYRILRRTIIDGYRRRSASDSFLARLEAEFDSADLDEVQKEICGCFTPLLVSLKPEYAAVIQTVDLEERSIEDVADQLRITPNNLKVRLHRARQQLKERLIECCGRCAEHGCLDCTCDSTSKSSSSATA